MRHKLATKISVAILGVVALALSSSVVALFSMWHIGELMQQSATENLSSLRAAEELKIALLETRGLVVSFVLDNGNPDRLKDLLRKKRAFQDALERARKTAHTSCEIRILDDLEEAYQDYDELRTEVIARYQSGDKEKASAIYLSELSVLSRQVDRLSAEFIAENKRYIDSTSARTQRQVSRVTWLVAGFSGLTIGLSMLLAWLFFHNVLFPLRGISEDIRERIFEPFYSTKDDGTGLGLCIAAQIMVSHSGRLVLESSTQKGTTFAVCSR